MIKNFRKAGAVVRLLAAVLALPFFLGCAAANRARDTMEDRIIGPGGRMNLDFASSPTLYLDTRIQKAEMQVMVHPNVNLESKPTALFVPFGVTQKMNDALAVSQGVSCQLWQAMLQRNTFSALEMPDMRPPYRVDMALALARSMGADMLVGGYITYYFDGGQNRDSKISIQMEIYDVSNGNLLWSIAHAAVMPAHAYKDFMAFQVKRRMPEDPMGALLRSVGGDFAQLVHMWSEPGAYRPPAQGKNYFEPALGTF